MRTCDYCSKLHKAIHNQNYCSKKDDRIDEVSTNAYYFKSNQISSGKHLSRLSIRLISDGFQEYQINKTTHVLDKDHYMVINQGQEFESQIKTVKEIEGFVIAFNPADLVNVLSFFQNDDLKLLDDPFDPKKTEFYFPSYKIHLNDKVVEIVENIKKNISDQNSDRSYYEDKFYDLLEYILRDHHVLKWRVDHLAAKKKSTRNEIFKRVNTAREYVDANISDNISLHEIAKIAEMSPYHFHRSFKQIFQNPFNKYVQNKRLLNAKFLLRDSRMSIGEILNQIGYNDPSAFSRAFKKTVGMSPTKYRIAQA